MFNISRVYLNELLMSILIYFSTPLKLMTSSHSWQFPNATSVKRDFRVKSQITTLFGFLKKNHY